MGLNSTSTNRLNLVIDGDGSGAVRALGQINAEITRTMGNLEKMSRMAPRVVAGAAGAGASGAGQAPSASAPNNFARTTAQGLTLQRQQVALLVTEERGRAALARTATAEAQTRAAVARSVFAEIRARDAGAQAMSREERRRAAATAAAERQSREGVKAAQREMEARRRLADNQAAHEARVGQQSAAQHREYLNRRLREEEAFTQRWVQLQRQRENIERQAERARTSRREIASRVVTGLDRGLTTVAAPVAAAASYSYKKFVDFDAAFTDVKKFVSGSQGELEKLRKDLRELALDPTVGKNFEELSAIAAEGGQRNVPLADMKEYVRAVALLGQTTDVSSEKGSEGLAKIASAMQLPATAYRNLASALAAVNSAGASSTSEVIETAQRFAGAAREYKISAGDLFAVSNVLVSLGQKQYAAGNSLSRIFDKTSQAVTANGVQLGKFAAVSGMTAAQFRASWEKDALGTVQRFVQQLDKLDDGRKQSVMQDLFGKGVQDTQALRALAAGMNLLTESRQKLGAAYESGRFHEDQAKIAAGSERAQWMQLRREIDDTAATLGESLAPAFRDALKATAPLRAEVKRLADAFHAMTPEEQAAIIKTIEIGAVATIAAGGILKLTRGGLEFYALLKDVGLFAPRAAAGVAGVGTGAAAAAGQVGMLSSALAALVTTAPITIPIVIAAAIAGAVAQSSIQKSEANIKAAERSAAEAAPDDIAASRAKITRLKSWRAQLENAGFASSDAPDEDTMRRLGMTSLWDAPGRPANMEAVLGKRDPKSGKYSGGSIARVIGEEEQGITRLQGIMAAAGRQEGREKQRREIETAAAQAETQLGKSIVKSAGEVDLGGKDVQAGCAMFVTEVLKKAGADFDGSAVAKDLRDQLLASGGRAKDLKDARPGDVLFFEGKGFGARKDKDGTGYHTGVYMGGGMVRDEGSRGVTTRPISSLLAGQKDARVYAVGVPESLGTSRRVRGMNGEDGAAGKPDTAAVDAAMQAEDAQKAAAKLAQSKLVAAETTLRQALDDARTEFDRIKRWQSENGDPTGDRKLRTAAKNQKTAAYAAADASYARAVGDDETQQPQADAERRKAKRAADREFERQTREEIPGARKAGEDRQRQRANARDEETRRANGAQKDALRAEIEVTAEIGKQLALKRQILDLDAADLALQRGIDLRNARGDKGQAKAANDRYAAGMKSLGFARAGLDQAGADEIARQNIAELQSQLALTDDLIERSRLQADIDAQAAQLNRTDSQKRIAANEVLLRQKEELRATVQDEIAGLEAQAEAARATKDTAGYDRIMRQIEAKRLGLATTPGAKAAVAGQNESAQQERTVGALTEGFRETLMKAATGKAGGDIGLADIQIDDVLNSATAAQKPEVLAEMLQTIGEMVTLSSKLNSANPALTLEAAAPVIQRLLDLLKGTNDQRFGQAFEQFNDLLTKGDETSQRLQEHLKGLKQDQRQMTGQWTTQQEVVRELGLDFDKLTEAQKRLVGQIARVTDEMKRMRAISEQIGRVAEGVGGAIGDGVRKGLDGGTGGDIFQSIRDSFSRMLKDLVADAAAAEATRVVRRSIERIALRRAQEAAGGAGPEGAGKPGGVVGEAVRIGQAAAGGKDGGLIGAATDLLTGGAGKGEAGGLPGGAKGAVPVFIVGSARGVGGAGGIGDAALSALQDGGGEIADGGKDLKTASGGMKLSSNKLATAAAQLYAASAFLGGPKGKGGKGKSADGLDYAIAAASLFPGAAPYAAGVKLARQVFKFAGGGDPAPGRVALGGELGPELFASASGNLQILGGDGPTLFLPTEPGTVYPADRTREILARLPGAAGGAGRAGALRPVSVALPSGGSRAPFGGSGAREAGATAAAIAAAAGGKGGTTIEKVILDADFWGGVHNLGQPKSVVDGLVDNLHTALGGIT